MLAVDCDDVMLMMARGSADTLTGVESTQLRNHISECQTCGQLAARPPVIVVQVSTDTLEDPEALTLPTIDRSLYDVEAIVGHGGMGQVLRATDRRLGRVVAIKEVVSRVHQERLEREAQVTAKLQHPAIVPIYEAGKWPNGNAFYTMRLVAGETLAKEIKTKKTFETRLGLLSNVVSVVDALAYAHAQGVIHRDLKPQNILVGEFGETVVIDWGLAKELGGPPANSSHEDESPDTDRSRAGYGGENLTRVGEILGTPGFMAPEQAAGAAADERSDVYALGAILYTVLAGQPPYWDTDSKASSDQLVEITIKRPPTNIETLAPSVPSDLAAIVTRAMNPEPGDRFMNAQAMASELHRFEAGRLLESRNYSVWERTWRWVQKHRALVGVVAAALLVVASVGAIAIINVLASRDDERRARRTAEAEKIELVFQQARAALATDPTATLAWLKQYPEDGPRRGAAGLLSVEARSRGVSWRVFESQSAEVEDLQFGGRRLFAAANYAPLRIWNLDSGESTDVSEISPGRIGYDQVSQTLLAPADGRIARYSLVKGTIEYSGKSRPSSIGGFPKFAFNRDQRVALLASHKELFRWSLSDDKRSRRKPFTTQGLETVGTFALFGKWTLRKQALDGKTEPEKVADKIGFYLGEPSFASSRLTGRYAIAHEYKVYLGSVSSDELTTFVPKATAIPTAVGISDDGKTLAVGNDLGEVTIFDVDSKTEITRFGTDGTYITNVAVTKNGDRVFAGTESGGLVIGTREELSTTTRLRAHVGPLRQLALSPDDALLATASIDGSTRVTQLKTLTREHELNFEDAPTDPTTGCDLYFEQDTASGAWWRCLGDEEFARVGSDGSVVRIKLPRPFTDDNLTRSILISRDGSTIVSPQQGSVAVWRNGERKTIPAAAGEPSLSSDGQFLIVPTGDTVEKWSIDEERVTETWPIETLLAVISPDSKHLLVERREGLAVVDLKGVTLGQHPSRRAFELGGVRWSSDSGTVAVESGDSQLLLFALESKQWQRLNLTDPDMRKGEVFVASDGGLVATYRPYRFGKKALYIWDTQADVTWHVDVGSLSSVRFENDAMLITNISGARARLPLPKHSHANLDAMTNAVVNERGQLVGRL